MMHPDAAMYLIVDTDLLVPLVAVAGELYPVHAEIGMLQAVLVWIFLQLQLSVRAAAA